MNQAFEIDCQTKINSKRLFIKAFHSRYITDYYLDALNRQKYVGLTEARHQKWDLEKVTQFIDSSNRPGKSILFGVFLVDGNKPIGNIRLFNFNKIHKRAELSFLFYDDREWGKGYATESLKAVLDYVFKNFELHRIHADYYVNNEASARIFEKLGFYIEGIYKDHFWLDDRYVDSIRVGLIAE